MKRSFAVTALVLLVAAGAAAQAPPPTDAFAAGRQRLAAGDPLEAAEAFHAALLESGAGRWTLRVGLFCDVANVEKAAEATGGAPELLVLRRSVGGRPCLAVYWGLFATRAAAQGAVASIPAALRAPGQQPVPVSDALPPGAPAPVRAAAAPPAPPVPVRTEEPPPAAPAPAAVAPAPEPEAPPVAPAPVVVATPAPRTAAVEPVPLPVDLPPDEGAHVPALEIGAAWSALWDESFDVDDADGLFEVGWMVSFNASLTRSLGIVGEASGHYGSQPLDVVGTLVDFDYDLLGVHAGPRYTHRGGGVVQPYVQALAGWTRTGFEAAGARVVDDAFSIQPGVGLKVRLSRSVGLGVGADYRLVFGEIENRNEARVHAGLVFAVGER